MRKHKVVLTVETKKRGLFGPKTVREKRTVWVDKKTWKKLRQDRPYTLAEMAFYDWVFDDTFL